MPYRMNWMGAGLAVPVALMLLWPPALHAQTPPDHAKAAAGVARPFQRGAIGLQTSPFLLLLRSAQLTPSQRQQVRQILRSHAAQNRPRFARLRAIRSQIADKLLGSAPVSESDLAPLEQQVLQLQHQIRQNIIDAALAIRKVLTPEQLGRVSELHQQLKNLRIQLEKLIGQGPN
jgi:Spy/CpxP family protein refolding chaperone